MSHNVILKFAAVVAAIFGIALAIAPNQLAALYKAAPMNDSGIYNSMLFGAFLIGLAVMNWAASTVASAFDARHVSLGNLAGNVVALVVAVTRQLTTGGPSQLGWINVAIFLVFAVLFGYLYFSESMSLEGRQPLR